MPQGGRGLLQPRGLQGPGRAAPSPSRSFLLSAPLLCPLTVLNFWGGSGLRQDATFNCSLTSGARGLFDQVRQAGSLPRPRPSRTQHSSSRRHHRGFLWSPAAPPTTLGLRRGRSLSATCAPLHLLHGGTGSHGQQLLPARGLSLHDSGSGRLRHPEGPKLLFAAVPAVSSPQTAFSDPGPSHISSGARLTPVAGAWFSIVEAGKQATAEQHDKIEISKNTKIKAKSFGKDHSKPDGSNSADLQSSARRQNLVRQRCFVKHTAEPTRLAKEAHAKMTKVADECGVDITQRKKLQSSSGFSISGAGQLPNCMFSCPQAA
ncbi:hypothetical protein NDU88_001678 [Pleurodeles waltl]|uniref:Uncharacterized protein n=1 Tax=Pleurodeles waltl TaxID=8319 RepID=A0AAV7T111_PLEWA|nr:hypothetical protein NDU88_001678 [Pleurodeles waltl]